ncbi:MAG: hypothetical protein WCA77_01820, partial [Thermoplasmata archaeon]
MTVDFELKKSPRMRLATHSWTGAWNDKRIRSEFEKLATWAREHKLRTGRWFFSEPGERRWQVGIEVKGKSSGSG